ncbi:MAG: hypothetical protein QM679_01730 [Patulibacter sp.]
MSVAAVGMRLPSYALGEVEHRVADNDSILPAVRDALVESGVDRYWSTELEPWQLAVASASRCLREAEVDPTHIDVVMYATNSFWSPEFSENTTVSRFLREVGLAVAFPIGVNLARCANAQVCFRQASAMLRSGAARRVLIVCVDKVQPGDDRLVAPKISVRTDAAASVLLELTDDAPFEVLDTELLMDAVLGGVDPELQFSEYIGGVARGLVSTVNALCERSGVGVTEVSALLPNNYNTWITRSMAKLGGFVDSQIYLDNVGRVAHAVAGDNLINLRDFSDHRAPAIGDHVLLLASGPSQWGATLLRKVW